MDVNSILIAALTTYSMDLGDYFYRYVLCIIYFCFFQIFTPLLRWSLTPLQG